MWFDTASELGLDLEELAHTQYDLDKPLPWDFVNVGLKKEWLQDEYKKAFAVDENSPHIVPTCQNKCVNCGVCPEFKVHKIMAKPYTASDKAQEIAKQCHRHVEHMDQKDIKEVYKYRIKLTKTGILKYFSHLDWQNTFFKAISRTSLKPAFSYGYNPTMKISMGVALPLFCESLTELIDINLWENSDCEFIKNELSKVMPKESQIISVEQIDKSAPSIDDTVYWAQYKVKIFDESVYDFDKFVYNTIEVLNSDEILIGKKTNQSENTGLKAVIYS